MHAKRFETFSKKRDEYRVKCEELSALDEKPTSWKRLAQVKRWTLVNACGDNIKLKVDLLVQLVVKNRRSNTLKTQMNTAYGHGIKV